MKYQRNDVELKRGRFRVRGGTIDVMGAGETVHRIVLDGRVVSLDHGARPGDPGGAPGALNQLSVFPATHFLTVDERLRGILERDRARTGRAGEGARSTRRRSSRPSASRVGSTTTSR